MVVSYVRACKIRIITYVVDLVVEFFSRMRRGFIPISKISFLMQMVGLRYGGSTTKELQRAGLVIEEGRPHRYAIWKVVCSGRCGMECLYPGSKLASVGSDGYGRVWDTTAVDKCIWSSPPPTREGEEVILWRVTNWRIILFRSPLCG